MTEMVFLVEEAAEGGFTARGVGEAVFTEADTLEELRQAVRDVLHRAVARREHRHAEDAVGLRVGRQQARSTLPRRATSTKTRNCLKVTFMV